MTQLQLSSFRHPASIIHTFNGFPITFVEWKGQQIFFVDEIAAALGYNSPRYLTDQIRREWSDEAEAGEEFFLLSGGDLQIINELRKVGSDCNKITESNSYDVDDEPTRGGARKLLVLTESGINLVCFKTEKPAGRVLRRWIAREVLPAIRRTGTYSAPSSSSQGIELADLRRRVEALEQGNHGQGKKTTSQVQTEQGMERFVQAWIELNNGEESTATELVPIAERNLCFAQGQTAGDRSKATSLGKLLGQLSGLSVLGFIIEIRTDAHAKCHRYLLRDQTWN